MTMWYQSGLLKMRAGGAHYPREAPLSGLFYEKYDHLDTVWVSSGLVSGFRELYELLGSVRDFNSLNRACELEMGVLNVGVIDAVFKSHRQDGKRISLQDV